MYGGVFMNTISFPNLGGVEFNVTKTLLRIGPVTIYWYGVIIALSFALAIFYCMKRCARFGISSDNLIDMVLAATPAAIIGARLYYVVFNYSNSEAISARCLESGKAALRYTAR